MIRPRELAARCASAVDAPWFNLAGFTVILVNAAAMGLETYDALEHAPALKAVEYLCVTGFVLELLVRFGAHLTAPGRFFRDGWNIFDLAIVIAPALPGVRENVTLLRLLRLARLLRTFRLFPSLRVIMVGIRRSLPGLGSFLLVTVLVLYAYAMLGWMMFGHAYPERYGTVGQAMLTLFLLLSLDGITDTLQAGREVTEWAVLYYVSYMVTACYLLTNLLVGVVLTALQEAQEAERAAQLAQQVRKVPATPEKQLPGAAAVAGLADDAENAPPPGPAPAPAPVSVREQLDHLRAAVDALEAQLTANLAGARDTTHALSVHGHVPHAGPAVVHARTPAEEPAQ
ncbi:ion transporter [Actinoplanes sp. NPDC051851]|uniref:ion transporter n=1 Tax=Actinoplanes sp. NPDC051851 TaxID=3154753 RepID=UPI00343E27B0